MSDGESLRSLAWVGTDENAALHPLTGKCVLLLRPEAQTPDPTKGDAATAEIFRGLGADVTQIALSKLGPPTDGARFARARADAAKGAYDWVLFTSAHGVARFFSALHEEGATLPQGVQVGCIGPATASALAPFGVEPALVASESHGEGLSSDVAERLRGERKRILLARAEVARAVLPESLRAAGHDVDDVGVYRSELARERGGQLKAWLAEPSGPSPRIVVFSSPSSVDAFLGLSGHAGHAGHAGQTSGLLYASIGPVTTARCRERGLEVRVEANPSTFPALAVALSRHFTG